VFLKTLATVALVSWVSSFFFSFARADISATPIRAWVATPTEVREGPSGRYEGKILQRYVIADGKPFAVGNIVYVKFPKTSNSHDFSATTVAEELRIAMGFRSWNHRQQLAAHVYESEWTATRRFVRVYMTEDRQSISYAVALFRMAYADTLAGETELIQRELLGVQDMPVPWLKRALEAMVGIPSAHAEGVPCPMCAPGDIPCQIQQAGCAGTNQQNALGRLSNDVNALSGVATALQPQVGVFNKNYAETLKEYRATREMLQNFMRPENLFMFAAASAGGAALGAMAVNAAVDVIAAGGRAIWDAITGEGKAKAILERFKNAREIWEKTSSAAVELEKSIDEMLALKQLAKSFNIPREKVVAQLALQVTIYEAFERKAQKALDDAIERGDGDCASHYAQDLTHYKQGVVLAKTLQARLNDPSIDSALCIDLKKKLLKVREAEGVLQEARLAILAGQEQWATEWNAKYKKMEDDVKTAKSLPKKVNLQLVAAAHERYKKARAVEENFRDTQIVACKYKKAPPVLRSIPIIAGAFTAANISTCKEWFQQIYGKAYEKRLVDLDLALKKDLEVANSGYTTATQNMNDIKIHNGTVSAEAESYIHWFKQVSDDQACLNNPSACKDANGKQLLMTRFDALAKKTKDIEAACTP